MRRDGWGSNEVDPNGATSPTSWRGGLPYRQALQAAMRDTPLGVHRQALEAAAGVGSGNFNFVVPVARYPGRGEQPLTLDLIYNSRVWQRADSRSTSPMIFDIDHDWPAPGWLLGFGKMVSIGGRRCMLVGRDGTRHPSKEQDRIEHLNGGWGVVARTKDGSFITYSHEEYKKENYLIEGRAQYLDGSVVEFKAPSVDHETLYPTRIIDRNGNYLSVAYRAGTGPEIETVTDTCGRIIRFHYDSEGRLTALTGPGATGKDVRLVSLHYSVRDLEYSFASGISVVPPGSVTLLDAIFFHGTATGYSFQESGDYSTYGMLRRVRECRGMTLTSGPLGEQERFGGGAMSRLREYDYPDGPGKELDDSPTYSTMDETWAGQPGSRPFSTSYEVTQIDSTVQTEITHFDGSRTVQSLKPGPDASQGVFSQLVVEDRDGNRLQQTDTEWESGDGASPRIRSVRVTDQRDRTTMTTFAYDGAVANQATEVRHYDYDGITVLRRTHTDYVSNPVYDARHILNLPERVQVFDRRDVATSWIEYAYDGSPLRSTPGVVGLHESFDPANREWIPEHYEIWFDNDGKPHWEKVPGAWVGDYDEITRYRGNPTLVRRFADAARQGGPVTDTRAYDLCGNLVTTDLAGRRTEYLFRRETQYSQPSVIVTGSPDPTSSARIQTATTYNSAGLPHVVTDANEQKLEINYDEVSLRPRYVASWTTWCFTAFDYDDSAMTQTRTVYAATRPSTITSKEVTGYDGKGRLASHKREAVGGDWDVVEYQSDQLGRERRQSAPHREGQSPSWAYFEYDPLDRLRAFKAPDDSIIMRHYDEKVRPSVARDLPGPTVRMVDAWGRERWAQFDALGQLEQVVEPDASGTGAVLPPASGSVTRYTYDGNGNLIELFTGYLRQWWTGRPQGRVPQSRQFRYDSLNRITHAYMPECGSGLDDAGGTSGPTRQWSKVFTYDERSNLTSRKDNRGIATRYDYAGDPLDRVQRISYDMSGFLDNDNPVLPCPDVIYTYETTGDLRRVRTETANGVCTQRYTYDAFAGLTSASLRMDALPEFPFEVGYGHDTLGRITTMTYPALYGEPTATRPMLRHEYGIGNTPAKIAVGSVEAASNFSFNAAGQITSMLTGPAGAQQVTETYAYDDWHQWLQSQRLSQDGALLLDLEYDYHTPPSSDSGKTGQVTNCRDHLDENNTRTYTYDALARLEKATGGPDDAPLWNEDYTYDEYGNRTGVAADGKTPQGSPVPRDGAESTAFETSIQQSTNRVRADGVRYDAAGNQVAGTEPGTGAPRHYQYDAAGRLAVISDNRGTPITKHIYGACNRRRASQEGEKGPVTYYVWSGNSVIAEYINQEPTHDELYWLSTSLFLGSRLLARRYRGDQGYADSRLQYEHPDQTGTRYVTGLNGSNRDELVLPYGTPLDPSSNASPGFTSYDRDPRTGLDYAVNRFYDPGLGRFLQPDPIGPLAYREMDPQSLNLYAYVGNDPVNHTDPLGLADEENPLDCKGDEPCTERTFETKVHGKRERAKLDDSPMPDVVMPGGGVGGGGTGGTGGTGERAKKSPLKVKCNQSQSPSSVSSPSGGQVSGAATPGDLLDVFSWKPSGSQYIGSIVTSYSLAVGSSGGLGIGVIAGTGGAGVAIIASAILSSAWVGIGTGTMLDRYMTGVIGQPLGSFAFDVWEKAEQAFSGAEKDDTACGNP